MIGEPLPLPAPLGASALGGDLFSAFLELVVLLVVAEGLKRDDSVSLSFSAACLPALEADAGLAAGETDDSPFLRPPFFSGVAGGPPVFVERGEARWFRGVEPALPRCCCFSLAVLDCGETLS